MHIIVISGRSGSGKSSALDLLEDEGFTCIDNLPVSLLPALFQQLRKRDNANKAKIAIGIDARNIDGDFASIPTLLESTKQSSDEFTILYLDTSIDVLIKRFSETRRKHPLSNTDTGLREAITEEDSILAPLAALADVTIDTTHLSLHELRSTVKARVMKSSRGMAIMITSFGFKFGVPVDADLIFDVRCLPNPYWQAELRGKSGLEKEVQAFLQVQEPVQEMQHDIFTFVDKWIPSFQGNNRSYLTVAIGCTGGMHRSVFLAENISRQLTLKMSNIQVRHRELDKQKNNNGGVKH